MKCVGWAGKSAGPRRDTVGNSVCHRVRSRVSLCGICGGQIGTWKGLSPSTSVFPCQFHSTCDPLHGKMKKPHHLHHWVAQ